MEMATRSMEIESLYHIVRRNHVPFCHGAERCMIPNKERYFRHVDVIQVDDRRSIHKADVSPSHIVAERRIVFADVD